MHIVVARRQNQFHILNLHRNWNRRTARCNKIRTKRAAMRTSVLKGQNAYRVRQMHTCWQVCNVHWRFQVSTSHLCVCWILDQDRLSCLLRCTSHAHRHTIYIWISLRIKKIETPSNECENSPLLLILHSEAQTFNCRYKKKLIFEADFKWLNTELI